jgi:hypothetical protein
MRTKNTDEQDRHKFNHSIGVWYAAGVIWVHFFIPVFFHLERVRLAGTSFYLGACPLFLHSRLLLFWLLTVAGFDMAYAIGSRHYAMPANSISHNKLYARPIEVGEEISG